MANLQDLYNAILNGKLEQAVAVTQEAIFSRYTRSY
ncbi:unknown [Parabacteroides sp. CAG:409]|nr:unknown [Parabacteroides sp. CAG:409]